MLPNLSNRNTIEISADIADNILKNKDNAKSFFCILVLLLAALLHI